jgi:hypothetical protein
VRVALAALLLCVACGGRRIPDFHGVRLGMTPRDLRDRFDVRGDFRVESTDKDMAMAFVPKSDGFSARFEFHDGMLVAVRADLPATDAYAQGADLVVTRAEVLHRDRRPDGVHVDWLSRECPTHQAEANRLAAGR